MRSILLAGGLLLAGACASVPPHDARTLCERPARPAVSVGDPEAEASFQVFAQGWLGRLREAGAPRGRAIGDEFETELRATGDARAPWVGLLRYCERQAGRSTVVTELFRYERGEWVD